MEKNRNSVYEMVFVAFVTAVTCVVAPFSIQIGPVPISFTNFIIYLSLYLLGWKKGVISYLLYLVIGMIGIPVFSGFGAGLGKVAGPTGGYLIGFIFMAVISGICIEKFSKSTVLQIIGMIVGTVVCYLFGTIWLAYQAGMSFYAALAAGVLPFIIGDFIKIIVSAMLGPILRKSVKHA